MKDVRDACCDWKTLESGRAQQRPPKQLASFGIITHGIAFLSLGQFIYKISKRSTYALRSFSAKSQRLSFEPLTLKVCAGCGRGVM